MLLQLVPPLSQRSHWYAYPVGLFDQVPLLVVSVWPCCAVPETAGSTVFDRAAAHS